jgi:hypothetical protein
MMHRDSRGLVPRPEGVDRDIGDRQVTGLDVDKQRCREIEPAD